MGWRERRSADRGSSTVAVRRRRAARSFRRAARGHRHTHLADQFYDRICEAICRLTTMRRAAIFMADGARRRVRAIGSYGIPIEQLTGIRPTLVNTPIAQRALLEDKVVVVSERIEEEVPPEDAQLLGVTTLVCTPLSAGGYAYGVICADRGGGRFELSDGERHLMWTLGKTAALVGGRAQCHPPAGAHPETRRAARSRARDPRERAPAPVRRVLGAGRRAAARPRRARTVPDRDAGGAQRPASRPGAAARAAGPRDRHDARGRARPRPAIAGIRRRGRLARRVDRPADLEPLAQSVLAEALRNIAKHADPSRVEVAVSRDQDTFTLEVRNDGARPRGR